MQCPFKQLSLTILKFLIYTVVFTSLTWSLLSVITIIKNSDSGQNANGLYEGKKTFNLSLPKFSSFQGFTLEAERLSLLIETYPESDWHFNNQSDRIINAAIVINLLDSTIALQLVTADQCSCPSEVRDRFEVSNKIINPDNFAEYIENEIQGLTAEDLNSINRQLILERRVESDQH